MAVDKEQTERRVYNLPNELVHRIQAYQIAYGIASETEAARRLLDSALQMRDSIDDIMRKLISRFRDEKDLRVLSSEVLIHHPLVSEVKFLEDGLQFRFQGNIWGRITRSGAPFTGEGDEQGWVRSWDAFSKNTTRLGEAVQWPSDKAKPGSDLDDDIPF